MSWLQLQYLLISVNLVEMINIIKQLLVHVGLILTDTTVHLNTVWLFLDLGLTVY